MRSILYITTSLSILAGCSGNPETSETEITMKYPETAQKNDSTVYFGTVVKDPYRWLEDDMSEETGAWVKEQNKFTFDYLDKIPFRSKIKDRFSELWDYEKVGAPFVEGGVTYYYKNDGLQNQYVLYKENAAGQAEVFIDPNKFSTDGTISLGDLSFCQRR
jgi:prolyl oligopeptidase